MTAPAHPRAWPPRPRESRLIALHRARRAAWRASAGNHAEFRRRMRAWLDANPGRTA